MKTTTTPEETIGIIDWEGLKQFDETTPPPTGRSIFDSVRNGIYTRIILGYTVPQIAKEISTAAKLSTPIKEATLRTWLVRRGISCKATRKEAVEKGISMHSLQPFYSPAPVATAAHQLDTPEEYAERGEKAKNFAATFEQKRLEKLQKLTPTN
jgi:hypothetical protein